MATIPTSEPAYLQAGDTLSWQRSLPDYPASAGWELSYRLINSSGKIDITAAASGDDHLVSVSAATTAAYAPGTYTWQAFVTNGSERYTVGSGSIVVKRNLAAEAGGFEARSTAQKALDDLRAALATWIATSGQVQEYEIAGRRMKYRTVADIRSAISLLEREVARERAAERIAAGLDTGRRVSVRF